jgi:hypothetical protein
LLSAMRYISYFRTWTKCQKWQMNCEVIGRRAVNSIWSWAWWLIPINPGTWEAEIVRIKVWGQVRQKLMRPPSPISWIVVLTCNPSYKGGIAKG